MISLIGRIFHLPNHRLEIQPVILRKRGLDHGQLMEIQPITKIEDEQFHE